MSFREEFLATHGPIIDVRAHPEVSRTIQRWAAEGFLVRRAPGVYLPAEVADDSYLRILAGTTWLPDSIVCGHTAAFVHGILRDLPAQIELACQSKHRAPGFKVALRTIPAEYVIYRGPIPVTDPVLTAVDLAATDGGNAIDWVSRTYGVHPTAFEAALLACPKRAGNKTRRKVVERTASRPWSQAERLLHTILDNARVRGWTANHRVVVAGQVVYIDVAFPNRRLAIEVDSWEFHSGREAFESDRSRHNLLVTAGWTTIRLTWAMLQHPDQVVQVIRAALRKSPAR